MKYITFICLTVLCIGTVHSQTVNYRYGTANFPVSVRSGENWTVVFHDQRYYVLDGTTKPSFVGWVRAKPRAYSLFTQSGEALASDFSLLIGNTLIANGFSVSALTVPIRSNFNQVRQIVANQKPSDKILLFTLNEWRTHQDAALELHYDIVLSILDGTGKVLAQKQLADLDILGRNRRPERLNLSTAVSDIFAELFNSKEIEAALKPSSGKVKMNTEVVSIKDRKNVDVVVQPLPVEPLMPIKPVEEESSIETKLKSNPKPISSRCTTTNILDMKRIGMTDKQVLAECPDNGS
ncbi:hypothetical protein ACFL17_02665 [Pseudomonadota bacterium]